MTAGEMPYCWLPSNAQPLSFKRIRRYAGELCAMNPSLLQPDLVVSSGEARAHAAARLTTLRRLRHDLLDEVGGLLFYSLTDLEAPEALHLRFVRGEQITNALLVVLHEYLTRERDLVDELAELTLDHFREDLGRLFLIRGLRDDDLALFVE